MRMLVGAELTLTHHKPTLMIEVIKSHLARAGDNSSLLYNYLENFGYDPYKWDYSSSRFIKISTPEDNDVFFINKENNCL